jgi:hypothetical protein
LHLLALAVCDWWERKDSPALLLLLWTFGVFTFATVVNWSINGRSFLPLAPAAGLLVARRLNGAGRGSSVGEPAARRARGSTALLFLPAVLGLLLSLLLVQADTNEAKAQRDAATDLCTKYQRAGRTVWFEGHWGIQYYMEKSGARPLDMVHPEAKPGDVVVVPNSAPGVSRPDPNTAALVEAVKYQRNRYGSTMNPSLGAGFYNVYRGPMPFAAGRIKPDYYLVFEARP